MTGGDIDYDAIASRAADVVLSADERAALRVWADALEIAGDPRGELVALEQALRDARVTEQRARALAHAMAAHLVAHPRASELVGELTGVLRYPRALALDWRAGHLIGARLDTRFVIRDRLLTAAARVQQILDAPAATTLRRLYVRVRSRAELDQVVALVRAHRGAPRLEELVVGETLRVRDRARDLAHAQIARTLVEARPSLWFVALHDVVIPLPLVAPVSLIDPPELLATRVRIGRAITSPAPDTRSSGLHAIVTLGPRAFMFVDALLMMMQPRVAGPQMVSALAAIGGEARVAIPALRTLTGRAVQWNLDVRRAAGVALAQLG